MRAVHIFLIFIITFTPAATADTLCRPDEVVYFSCGIENSKKIVSLCGNKKFEFLHAANEEQLNKEVWLQYRFGVPGKLELVYPEQKYESLNKFKATYTRNLPGTTSSLFFVTHGIVYSVNVWEIWLEESDTDNSFYGVVVMDESSFFGRAQKSDNVLSKERKKIEVRLRCAHKPILGSEYNSIVHALDVNK